MARHAPAKCLNTPSFVVVVVVRRRSLSLSSLLLRRWRRRWRTKKASQSSSSSSSSIVVVVVVVVKQFVGCIYLVAKVAAVKKGGWIGWMCGGGIMDGAKFELSLSQA